MVEYYQDLVVALGRLPNGFPATKSGVEIEILKRIFSPEEAFIASYLGKDWETVAAISVKTGQEFEFTQKCLAKMASRGLVWGHKKAGDWEFRLAPFVVGIYEAQKLDVEMAWLVEEYLSSGGAEGIMRPQPAIHRVIPAQKAVKSEWIMPYDDIRSLLMGMKSFSVRGCICREQQRLLGHPCDFPEQMCLNFSAEEPLKPGGISLEEALGILDRAEEIGLVHTVSNTVNGVGYLCNCCGCCCGILRGITDWGIESSVAQANFYAVIDPQLCAGCGICINRCQVKAISDHSGTSFADRQRCIGCGLCVTGCPNNAARLERKPKSEWIDPPSDFVTWENDRLRYREQESQSS